MGILRILCYILFTLCLTYTQVSSQATVIALQASGATFQGTREQVAGRTYLAFRGIPYAKTIGGAKRWTVSGEHA